MIAANRIKFQKIFSNELNIPDLIMECAFDSDNSEVSTYLNREGVSMESYDGRHNNTIRYKYSERFSPRFTFLKKGFGDFDSSELRSVLKWLTSSDVPTLLDVYYDDSNVVGFSAVGNWTEISSYKLANNRTVGIVATFEAVHPFALSDLYAVTKTITSADNKITINIDTDDNKPVYPRVIIQEISNIVRIEDGAILVPSSDMVKDVVYYNGTTYYWKSDVPTLCVTTEIPVAYRGWPVYTRDGVYNPADTFEEGILYDYTNDNLDNAYWINPDEFKESLLKPDVKSLIQFANKHTDFFGQSKTHESISLINNTSGEKIIVDGANKIISSNKTGGRIFGDEFNWVWLELYDGKNELTIEGDCTVTLEWREVRKVGEY